MLKLLHKKPHIQGFLKLSHTVINLTYVQSYKEIARPRPDDTPCIYNPSKMDIVKMMDIFFLLAIVGFYVLNLVNIYTVLV